MTQMETVEVVIRLPEEQYEYIRHGQKTFTTELCLLNGVHDGIVLPKGHGRLGDLDALYEDVINGIKAGNYEEGYEKYAHINNMDDCVECVKYADTIIEADKGGER